LIGTVRAVAPPAGGTLRTPRPDARKEIGMGKTILLDNPAQVVQGDRVAHLVCDGAKPKP
jgi:hypothetical protein